LIGITLEDANVGPVFLDGAVDDVELTKPDVKWHSVISPPPAGAPQVVVYTGVGSAGLPHS
jgi:hypothetical protein